jgi:hypothetical protein
MERFIESEWAGQPNYVCTECPRADLDKENLLRFQATSCKKDGCPGKPHREEPKPTAVGAVSKATAMTNGTKKKRKSKKQIAEEQLLTSAADPQEDLDG